MERFFIFIHLLLISTYCFTRNIIYKMIFRVAKHTEKLQLIINFYTFILGL